MSKVSRKTVRRSGTALAAVILIMAAGAASAKAGDRVYTFKIPAENTAKALNDFARQANLQIMFPYDLAAQHSATAISGQFTRADVLARLLDGTGLEVAEQTDTSVTLRVATPAGAKASAGNDTGSTEVIVTGTHIRGGNPTAPIHTLTQKDIEQSGYSQVGDLMRSLPENFSGGQNPGVMAAGSTNIGNANYTNASSINLRGLGSDATLTLLNGHRLSGDATNPAADITGIPLSALLRVEVVPDGASALYGSDAVAGVVNFITRKNYDGAEFSANLGNSSQGGGYTQTYTALGGIARSNWHVLANIEYAKQNQILASQRPATNAIAPVNMLLQSQTRRSAFINAGVAITDHVSLNFDGLVSDRSSFNTFQYTTPSSLTQAPYDTPAYSGALSLDMDAGNTWKVHVTGGQSGSRNIEHTYRPTTGARARYVYQNSDRFLEALADGTLLTLPTGDLKAAFGAGERKEYLYSSSDGTGTRTVTYAFAEAFAPLVAPSDDRPGLHALELNLSGRAENYSDAGSTTNPKIGLRYVPLNGLTFRTTAGTSFKAPTLLQLHSAAKLYLYPGSIFSLPSNTLFITLGANPDLKPETSRSWTFGADFSPPALKSLTLSATYFNIDYRNRIISPIQNLTNALTDPTYATYVEKSPTAARQSDLIAHSSIFTNLVGTYDPAKVYAIIQDKFTNAAAQNSHGLDISYRQSFRFGDQTLGLFANATATHFDQQLLSTTPDTVLSGIIFNVPKLKARGGANWTRGGWSATGIINYISGETNVEVKPNANVASWTTVDATLNYRFQESHSLLQGVRIGLSVSNLFDNDPPFAKSSGLQYPSAIYYDSTNASVVGRFASVTIAKAW